ncbi:MAG: ABC transporter ATP-binding protein [Candidatus Riflebacteria bacterium]|nr:ABC transporter ATP-binding protein [Candidatus Riflebacteria bacterium]
MTSAEIKEKKLSPLFFFFSLLKPYKKYLLIGFLALFITNLAQIFPPMFLNYLIDKLTGKEEISVAAITWSAFAIFALSAIKGIGRFAWRYHLGIAGHNAVFDLRTMLFIHLMRLPSKYFKKARLGDLMSVMTNDIQQVVYAMSIGFVMFYDALFFLTILPLIMIWMSPKLALVMLLPFVLLSLSQYLLRKLFFDRAYEVRKRLADLTVKAEENLSGIRIVKGYCLENSEIASFEDYTKRYKKASVRSVRLAALREAIFDMPSDLALFLLMFLGGTLVLKGEITIGVFVAFQSYMIMLRWPMTAVSILIQMFQETKAALFRCITILEEEPVYEHNDKLLPPAVEKDFAMTVKALCFAYPEGTAGALSNVSFTLKSGETLGITGPVGSFKSTLLKALMRIYEPQGGEVLFNDSVSSKDLELQEFQNYFAFVPQESFLFSESIQKNILFACEDQENKEKAEHYAILAGLKKDLDSFPDGLQTLLGERGVNLSGGQKQRVSLARALASERPVLLLDDFTSAVDVATENQIIAAVKENTPDIIKVIVSHRIKSIADADHIICLSEDGKISQEGTHEELLKTNGLYASLWERQKEF